MLAKEMVVAQIKAGKKVVAVQKVGPSPTEGQAGATTSGLTR